jgi:hypothetical protein
MADMQALAAAITAAIQAATAAAAPPPNFAANLQTAVTNAINAAQQPPPVIAGAFALHPATVSAASIDYSTSTGAKLYLSATEQLQDDALYSLDDPDNNLLIENLTTRASASGWEPIFLVNNDHLLEESYGAILRTDITTHVRTILANANRAKQSDAQLLKCLKNSVDANTKATMAASHTDWRAQPAGAAAADPLEDSGILYLYTLLEKSEVTSRSLCSHIKRQLGQMNTIMHSQAKSDIKKFNHIIDEHLLTLRKHQQPLSDDDLINFLFVGYIACSDKNFVTAMERVKDDWELDHSNITPQQLMKLALNKYDTRVLEKSRNKPSSEEREIVALKAQITKLSSTSKQSSTGTSDASASTSDPTITTNNKRRRNGKHKSSTFTGMKNKVWTGDNKWRGEAPSPGAPTTKVVKGKTYHYCSHHKCWLGHTTAQCKAAAKESSGTSSNITASLANIGLADIVEEDDDPADDE